MRLQVPWLRCSSCVLTLAASSGMLRAAETGRASLREAVARTLIVRTVAAPFPDPSSLGDFNVETVTRLFGHRLRGRSARSRKKLDFTWRLVLSPGADPDAVIRALNTQTDVVTWAQREVAGQVARLTTNDPDFPLQWGMLNNGQEIEGVTGLAGADIDMQPAWAVYSGRAWTTIAIVGTGVDSHLEFADRLLPGRAMVGDLFDTRDSCGHGTHVAGIMAATAGNGMGIAGIHDRARILPVRVFDGCTGTASPTAEGIVWAVDAGADVIVAPVFFGAASLVLEEAIAYAHDANVVVVAPVGNDASPDLTYPAAYETCLGAAATTNLDTAATFSNFGPHVDVAAPGAGIYSTADSEGFEFQSGTSSAAAFSAGLASLLRSYAPQLDEAAIRALIRQGAEDLGHPGVDLVFGSGRINALNSLLIAPIPALRFENETPFPATVTPDGRPMVAARVVGAGEELNPNSVQLFYRAEGEPFDSVSLTESGPNLFSTLWPELPCGSTVEYFFVAESNAGTAVFDPVGAPANVFTAKAIRFEQVYHDDFEVEAGWTAIAAGGAQTSGQWVRVVPVGTSAQPAFDYSPDGQAHCFVTGQHSGGNAGTSDVDIGPVTLLSPVIDLPSDAHDIEVRYACWFSSTGGDESDTLTVHASLDGGATWPIAAEVIASTDGWEERRWHLSDFPPTTGHQLRLRFVTSDLANDSLTEAAVDEVSVLAIHCQGVLGDVDGNGSFDSVDFHFLSDCWSGPNALYAGTFCRIYDANDDGDVDLEDARDLFAAFDSP